MELGELYGIGEIEAQYRMPNSIVWKDLLLNNPNGSNPFTVSIAEIQSSKYRDANGNYRKGFREFSLKISIGYSSHWIELNKLIAAEEIKLKLPLPFISRQWYSFVLENTELLKNWLGGFVTAARQNSLYGIGDSTDEYIKSFNNIPHSNPIPSAEIDLQFVSTEAYSATDIESLFIYEPVIIPPEASLILTETSSGEILSNGDEIVAYSLNSLNVDASASLPDSIVNYTLTYQLATASQTSAIFNGLNISLPNGTTSDNVLFLLTVTSPIGDTDTDSKSIALRAPTIQSINSEILLNDEETPTGGNYGEGYIDINTDYTLSSGNDFLTFLYIHNSTNDSPDFQNEEISFHEIIPRDIVDVINIYTALQSGDSNWVPEYTLDYTQAMSNPETASSKDYLAYCISDILNNIPELSELFTFEWGGDFLAGQENRIYFRTKQFTELYNGFKIVIKAFLNGSEKEISDTSIPLYPPVLQAIQNGTDFSSSPTYKPSYLLEFYRIDNNIDSITINGEMINYTGETFPSTIFGKVQVLLNGIISTSLSFKNNWNVFIPETDKLSIQFVSKNNINNTPLVLLIDEQDESYHQDAGYLDYKFVEINPLKNHVYKPFGSSINFQSTFLEEQDILDPLTFSLFQKKNSSEFIETSEDELLWEDVDKGVAIYNQTSGKTTEVTSNSVVNYDKNGIAISVDQFFTVDRFSTEIFVRSKVDDIIDNRFLSHTKKFEIGARFKAEIYLPSINFLAFYIFIDFSSASDNTIVSITYNSVTNTSAVINFFATYTENIQIIANAINSAFGPNINAIVYDSNLYVYQYTENDLLDNSIRIQFSSFDETFTAKQSIFSYDSTLPLGRFNSTYESGIKRIVTERDFIFISVSGKDFSSSQFIAESQTEINGDFNPKTDIGVFPLFIDSKYILAVPISQSYLYYRIKDSNDNTYSSVIHARGGRLKTLTIQGIFRRGKTGNLFLSIQGDAIVDSTLLTITFEGVQHQMAVLPGESSEDITRNAIDFIAENYAELQKFSDQVLETVEFTTTHNNEQISFVLNGTETLSPTNRVITGGAVPKSIAGENTTLSPVSTTETDGLITGLVYDIASHIYLTLNYPVDLGFIIVQYSVFPYNTWSTVQNVEIIDNGLCIKVQIPNDAFVFNTKYRIFNFITNKYSTEFSVRVNYRNYSGIEFIERNDDFSTTINASN